MIPHEKPQKEEVGVCFCFPSQPPTYQDKACNNYTAETQCGIGCGAGRAEL